MNTSLLQTIIQGIGPATMWNSLNIMKRDYDLGKIYKTVDYLLIFDNLTMILVMMNFTQITFLMLLPMRLLLAYGHHLDNNKSVNCIEHLAILSGWHTILYMVNSICQCSTKSVYEYPHKGIKKLIKRCYIDIKHKVKGYSLPAIKLRLINTLLITTNLIVYLVDNIYTKATVLCDYLRVLLNKTLNTSFWILDKAIGAKHAKQIKTYAQPILSLMVTLFTLNTLYNDPITITQSFTTLAILGVFQLSDMGFMSEGLNDYINFTKKLGLLSTMIYDSGINIMQKFYTLPAMIMNIMNLASNAWLYTGIYFNKLFSYMLSSEQLIYHSSKQKNDLENYDKKSKKRLTHLESCKKSKHFTVNTLYYYPLAFIYAVVDIISNTVYHIRLGLSRSRPLAKACEAKSIPLELELPENKEDHLKHWNENIIDKLLTFQGTHSLDENSNLTMSQTIFDTPESKEKSIDDTMKRISTHLDDISEKEWVKHGLNKYTIDDEVVHKDQKTVQESYLSLEHNLGSSYNDKQSRAYLHYLLNETADMLDKLKSDSANKDVYYQKLKDFNSVLFVCLSGITSNLITIVKLDGMQPKDVYHMKRKAMMTAMANTILKGTKSFKPHPLADSAFNSCPMCFCASHSLMGSITGMLLNTTNSNHGDNETHRVLTQLAATDPVLYKHMIQYDQNTSILINSLDIVGRTLNLGNTIFNIQTIDSIIDTTLTNSDDVQSRKDYKRDRNPFYFDSMSDEWNNISKRVAKAIKRDNKTFSDEDFIMLQKNILKTAIKSTLSEEACNVIETNIGGPIDDYLDHIDRHGMYKVFQAILNPGTYPDLTYETLLKIYKRSILPFALIDLMDQGIILHINDDKQVINKPSKVTTPKPSLSRTLTRYKHSSYYALEGTLKLASSILLAIPKLFLELTIFWPTHLLKLFGKKVITTIPKLSNCIPALSLSTNKNAKAKPTTNKPAQSKNIFSRAIHSTRSMLGMI